MPATPQPPSNTRDASGPLLPMLSAVLAVVGLVMLAALLPGVLTLLAALLAIVALMGALLTVMGRLLADEGEPDDEPASKGAAETAVPTHTSAPSPASTTRIAA